MRNELELDRGGMRGVTTLPGEADAPVSLNLPNHTFPEAPCISHSHASSAPPYILPVLLLDQNLVVIDGSAGA